MRNVLPVALRTALREALGTEPKNAFPVGGGMINHAAKVETAEGAVFVKWKRDAPSGFFAAEAFGLNMLRRAEALRVPHVLAMGEFSPVTMASEPDAAFLALEWIETRLSSDPARFDRNFGEGLAALHQSVPLEDIGFGLSQPNYIGLLPQRNDPLPDWSAFYRERRLLPQIEMARERGHLPERRERMLMQVVERLETLLDGLDSRPALLHGDLWSGNFLTAGDEPVLLDPAVYYGEREMEIAYMELFGGFPPGVPAAYQAAYPLEPGYARRRPLHQLYPLLNHLNHFGETYGPEVDHVCRLCLEIPSSCRWRE